MTSQHGFLGLRPGRQDRSLAGGAGILLKHHLLRVATFSALIVCTASFTASRPFAGNSVRGRFTPPMRHVDGLRAGALRTAVSMQADRSVQDTARFLATREQLPRADGGPFADTDVPAFLRLVRTGERWFELQAAVVTYTLPAEKQVSDTALDSLCSDMQSASSLALLRMRALCLLLIDDDLCAAGREARSGCGGNGSPWRSTLLPATPGADG